MMALIKCNVKTRNKHETTTTTKQQTTGIFGWFEVAKCLIPELIKQVSLT